MCGPQGEIGKTTTGPAIVNSGRRCGGKEDGCDCGSNKMRLQDDGLGNTGDEGRRMGCSLWSRDREEEGGSGRSYIPVFQIRMEKMNEVKRHPL
ncbi:hypothetical protein BHM03_00053245 [Ensete ventricosum]|nr:hypothetical protein BHM03_00053245 [Ensete ventricosum]